MPRKYYIHKNKYTLARFWLGEAGNPSFIENVKPQIRAVRDRKSPTKTLLVSKKTTFRFFFCLSPPQQRAQE